MSNDVARLSPDHLAAFIAIVGESHALSEAQDIAPYLVEERGLYHGASPLVLLPGTREEVAAICALAHRERIALVPQGGNTGLVGGQVAFKGEVVLSLRRLNAIRDIDSASATMDVEAGVILQNAQAAAAAQNLLLPLSLAAEGSCTIGGTIATNAGGTAALAYGVMRDLVMGLEVVLADGRILHGLSRLKKDNTGYDLKNLFIGAEGTLGVITAATLKLVPLPSLFETAYIALDSPDAALRLLDLARHRAMASLTSFELISQSAHDMAIKHGGDLRAPLAGTALWYVLMELSATQGDLRATIETLLNDALAQGWIVDAALAESQAQRALFWRLRESISPVQKREGGSIKHDVSVPVAQVPNFLAEAGAAARALVPGCRPCAFGHLGDGNIHFNISQPVGADKDSFLALWPQMNAAVHEVVMRLGGSISAEHGIGVLKRDLLTSVKDPVALDVMRTLKRMLDPHNILNPGKVLPD